jgi:hypothetical protein
MRRSVVVAQDSFVQLGPISSGEINTAAPRSVYEKSQHTKRMTSQSGWLYTLQAPSSSEEL